MSEVFLELITTEGINKTPAADDAIRSRGDKINWIWRQAADLAREQPEGTFFRSQLERIVSQHYPVTVRTFDGYLKTLEMQGRIEFNHVTGIMLEWPPGIDHAPKPTPQKKLLDIVRVDGLA